MITGLARAMGIVVAATFGACFGGCAGPRLPPVETPHAGPAGAELVVQATHGAEVSSIAFSPDGRHVASGSEDGSVRIWDVGERGLLRVYRPVRAGSGFAEGIDVTWLDDARVVASNLDREPLVYDIQTRAPPETFGGGRLGDHALARWVVLSRLSGSAPTQWLGMLGGPVLFGADGAITDSLGGAFISGSAVSSDDGRIILATSQRPELELRAYRAGVDTAFQKVDVGGLPAHAIAVTPAGDLALVSTGPGDGDPDDTVHLLRTKDFSEACRYHDPYAKHRIDRAAISRDGALAVVQQDWELVGLSVRTCDVLWSVRAGLVTSLAFSPDGRTLLIGNQAGWLFAREAATGQWRGYYGGPVPYTSRAAFPTPDLVAVSDAANQRTSLWSLSGAERVAAAAHHDEALSETSAGQLAVVSDLTFMTCRGPEGEGRGLEIDVPATAADTYATKRWFQEPFDGLPHGPVPPPAGSRVALCPLGARGMWSVRAADVAHGVAYVSDDDTLFVVDLATATKRPLAGSKGWVFHDLALSRDGSLFMADRLDGPARVWSARTGAAVADVGLAGADGQIYAAKIALAPDASAAAVAGGTSIEVHALPGGRILRRIEAPGEVRALAFGETAHELLVGDEDGVLALYRDGDVLHRADDGGGKITSIVVDPTGTRAVTDSLDGTPRVWSARTGEPLARLVEFNDDEWAVFTPDGLYTGTAEVEQRIGWSFSSPLEYFSLDHFPSLSSRAGVLARLAGLRTSWPRISRPPRVAISRVAPSGPRRAVLDVAASPDTRRVRAFVDGRDVATVAVAAGGVAKVEVPLRSGDNRVAVVGFDDAGFSSNDARMDVKGPTTGAHKPDIWVVAAGISAYPHLSPASQLPAATRDARAVAEAFGALAGDAPEKLYAAPHVVQVENEDVTRDAIRDAVERLAQMGEDDLAVVFFAGHGHRLPEGEMVYVLGSVGESGHVREEDVRASSVGWRDIAGGLAKARGRVVVLLDACNSGAITGRGEARPEAVAEELLRQDRAGVLVFAAAKGRQESLEPGGARSLVLDPGSARAVDFTPEDPHGFFTGALLAALRDPATDTDRDGLIETGELVDEVTERVLDVSTAAGSLQEPWVARREYFGDFAIAPVTCAAGSTQVAGKGCVIEDDSRCPLATAYVAGGTLSGDAGPRTVAPFCMFRDEVTVTGYGACVASGRCTGASTGDYCNAGRADRGDHPVNCVDAAQASAFCAAAGARLPTSDEWEIAASGGGHHPYPWGDAPAEHRVCGFFSTHVSGTCPVGAFPNGNGVGGIHDLAGNVSEWTTTPGAPGFAVRGTSFFEDPEPFENTTLHPRFSPDARRAEIGFRCVTSTR